MTPSPKRICVFCSTTTGHSPTHISAARALAHVLHAQGIHLVYGGGTTGLMGELAKTLVSLRGLESVHGIIPRSYISIERPEGAPDEAKKNHGPVNKGILGRLFKGKATKQTPAEQAVLLSESIYGRTTVVDDVQIRKKVMVSEVAKGAPRSGLIGFEWWFRDHG